MECGHNLLAHVGYQDRQAVRRLDGEQRSGLRGYGAISAQRLRWGERAGRKTMHQAGMDLAQQHQLCILCRRTRQHCPQEQLAILHHVLARVCRSKTEIQLSGSLFRPISPRNSSSASAESMRQPTVLLPFRHAQHEGRAGLFSSLLCRRAAGFPSGSGGFLLTTAMLQPAAQKQCINLPQPGMEGF